LIGQTLSHFKITAKLGEGGMGEVYRAEDTALDRDVAIKVLPEALTADPERLARFEREAKVLASLNHPNIAGIHQIEQADGRQLLVMELVEGEDLADRMEQGALSIEDAVAISTQVADGLQAAHERGIVHRDLKPANLKITPDGQVKILDFGLAKAQEATEASPDMTRSPTLTAQMTQAGVILGTAAYMSPEQARGQEADPRSDLWALGVVLWEMLSGRRLFAEPTVSDTLAAVLRAEIDLAEPRGDDYPMLNRVLSRCLQRDPKQRYHSAADLRLDLGDALLDAARPEFAAATPAAPTSRLPWIVATVAVLGALLTAALTLQSTREGTAYSSGPRMVTSILPPEDVTFANDVDGFALSPDGSQLAFVGTDSSGARALWLRAMAREEVRRLAETEDAVAPFWSPDGRWIAFGQDGQLKILNLETGLVEVLASMEYQEGGTWNRNGDIVFTGPDSTLMAVKQTGEALRRVTESPPGGNDYFRPSFLPDGQHFVFHERRYSSDENIGLIRIGSLDGGPSTVLFEAYSTADYVEPGFLLWWHQGNLRAQRFDAEALELTGEPFSLVSDILWDPRDAEAGFAASATGVLVYRSGGRIAGYQLTWVGRDGEIQGSVGPAGSIYQPGLSPDGRQVAVDISGDSNQGDIWIFDVEAGSGTPVVTWPEDDSYPVWSPDGRELAFMSQHDSEEPRIFRLDIAGGSPELLLEIPGEGLIPRAWSPDGGTLIFQSGPIDARNIKALDLASGEVRSLIEDAFDTENAILSPDGQWMAYDSDESGHKEVYLASWPDLRGKLRISVDGGFAPLWSPDGREIFFTAPGSSGIYAADVDLSGEQPRLGRPVLLFEIDMKVHHTRQYVTPDGQRFLVNRSLASGARTPLTVLQNWADEP
jgi:serine/threonine protein kinase